MVSAIILLMTLGMFLSMSQTDPVLSKFQMGRTKLQYVINHGLFPHFKQMILDEILKSPFLSVLYNESLNESIQ